MATITVVAAAALRRIMAPTASARTATTAISAAVPATMRSSVAHDNRRGRGDQPGHEAGRADHDRLRGQYPAPARAGGQGDADQAAPVLGRDEQRRDDNHRDQPGERADEHVREGDAGAARGAGAGRDRCDVAGPGHGELAAGLVIAPDAGRVGAAPDIAAGPAASRPRTGQAQVIEDGRGLAGSLVAVVPAAEALGDDLVDRG